MSARLEVLRDASAVLAKTESRDALVRALRLFVPSAVDHVVVDIYDNDGSMSHVVAFPTPELEALALDVARRFPPKPLSHPKEVAMRTGEIVFREITDELRVAIAHDEEHLAILKRFDATETLSIPLRVGARSLGVLTAATTHGRRFEQADRVLVELFAEQVATHLDRAFFKRSVLLVEDNDKSRYVLKRVLLHAGFAVREASTGEEALRLAREMRPDVVVLDVRLPDMLGFEVCRRMKSDALVRMPIIQMSASFVRPEDRVAAREHGADDYLIAPIEPDDLVAAIHSVLRVFEARDEGRRTIERERVARVELERANTKLRAVVASGLLGTFEWDANGTIVDANEALLALVGEPAEAVLGRTLTLDRLLAKPLRERGAAPESAPSLVERELVARDDRRIPVILGITHLDDDGDSGVAFVLDVTEQRRRAELESLLLAMVSHDLRNPLGVVTMASSILLGQDLPAMQHDLVRRIHTAGQRSARLVSDLLDFTLARGAGIELARSSVDLHAVVEQTIADLRAFWPSREVEHVRVGNGIASLDEDRIAQIATNLVGNALQHGPKDAAVRVTTRRDGGAVVLRVSNDGPPIADDLLPELFAPLRRGSDAGRRRGSLGLGLFIVQQLVRAHGGTIDVVSAAGLGTTFTVRFPDGAHELDGAIRSADPRSVESDGRV